MGVITVPNWSVVVYIKLVAIYEMLRIGPDTYKLAFIFITNFPGIHNTNFYFSK